jgi:hypothetical protein
MNVGGINDCSLENSTDLKNYPCGLKCVLDIDGKCRKTCLYGREIEFGKVCVNIDSSDLNIKKRVVLSQEEDTLWWIYCAVAAGVFVVVVVTIFILICCCCKKKKKKKKKLIKNTSIKGLYIKMDEKTESNVDLKVDVEVSKKEKKNEKPSRLDSNSPEIVQEEKIFEKDLVFSDDESDADDGYITYLFENKLVLTEEEKTRLIFHSFANVLNVFLGIAFFISLFIYLLDVIGKCRVCLKTNETGFFSFFVYFF